MLKKFIRMVLHRLRGEIPLSTLIKRGMKVGNDFWYGDNCGFDYSFCWLISIGNRVTLSSRVNLITHDASLKKLTGYVRLGLIQIEDDVFIGAGTTVLPNVRIGKGAVIGAGSLVNKDVPSGEVWAGNPARKIMDVKQFTAKYNSGYQYFDSSYTIQKRVSDEKKAEIIEELSVNKITFVE